MQLNMTQKNLGTFDEYFAACFRPGLHPSLVKDVKEIEALVRHLQENVDGPTQWLTFSILVIFYLADEDTWHHEKARVFVEAAPYGYEIRYRSVRKLDWKKSFTILKAHSVEEAGSLVVRALELAETNLPDMV